MELRRQRIDAVAFAFALAALAVPALGFVSTRNGAAVIMCGLCLAGLLAGRIVGVSGRALLPVALGLACILWLVWVDPPAGPRKTSAFAHAAGGALVGWALVETLGRRVSWPLAAAGAITGVFLLAGIWEVGEWLGDRYLDTALIPNKRDSAIDVFFGTAGATAGVAAARLLALWRQGRIA